MTNSPKKRALESSSESSEEENEEVYDVQRILAEESNGNENLYLVRWKGYADEECTWEPKAHFDDPLTLQEWVRQRDAGDFLPSPELEALRSRMEEHRQRKAEEEEARQRQKRKDRTEKNNAKRQRKRHEELAKAQALQTRKSPLIIPDVNLPRTDVRKTARPQMRSPILDVIPHVNSPRTDVRGTAKLQIRSPILDVEPSEPSKFYGVVSNRAPRKPETKERERLKSVGQVGFNNLRHMNNAQKRSRREQDPTASGANLRAVTDLPVKDPAHILRQTPDNESPLFFPERQVTSPTAREQALTESKVDEIAQIMKPKSHNRAAIEKQKAATEPLPTSGDDSVSAKPQSLVQHHMPESQRKALPEADTYRPEPRQADTYRPTRRVSNPHETQSPASVDHTATSSRHEPEPRRADTYRPARRLSQSHDTLLSASTDHTTTPAHYEPPAVYATDLRYAKSSGRQRTLEKDEVLVQMSFGEHEVGDVKIRHLPTSLRVALIRTKKEHKLPICFDNDKTYPFRDFHNSIRTRPRGILATATIVPYADTSVAVTRLAEHLEKHDAVSIWQHPDPREELCLVLYSPFAPSWPNAGDLAPAQNTPCLLLQVRRGPLNIDTQAKHVENTAPSTKDSLMPLDGTTTSALVPESDRQHAPNLSTRTSIDQAMQGTSSLGATSLIKSTANPALGTKPVNTAKTSSNDHVNDLVKETSTALRLDSPEEDNLSQDWTFSADLKVLTRSSAVGPWIFVAIPSRYETQIQAIKAWADEQTSKRFIFTEANEWDTFEIQLRGSRLTGLVFFHSGERSYCELKGLGMLLQGERLQCHSVSWETSASRKATYATTRLFPRGTATFLSEHAMAHSPRDTLFALDLFHRHSSQAPYWRLMVRPNIRAWLQQKAVDSGADDSRRDAFYEMLNLIHKLSPILTDVTIDPDGVRMELLDVEETLIVPMSKLNGYDGSKDADSSDEAIQQRDDILLMHFMAWTNDNVMTFRRFAAIDERCARNRPSQSEHIVFWSPQGFRNSKAQDKDKGNMKEVATS